MGSRASKRKPEDLLTLGQMAKASNVTEKALYLYQQKGILEPVQVDSETGRRYYSIEQSTRLDCVLYLQQAGFSLDDIRGMIDRKDALYLKEKLLEQEQLLERQQSQLARARSFAHHLTGDTYGESLFRFPRLFDMGGRMLYRFCMPISRA